MNIFLLGDVPNDLVSFTFFIGTMAMMAASVFFFLSLDAGGGKWRTSMLVSGLITFIAAVHYYYMRDASVSGGDVTFFRYVDWILTVPLMCVEFYLILGIAGSSKSLMLNIILCSSVIIFLFFVICFLYYLFCSSFRIFFFFLYFFALLSYTFFLLSSFFFLRSAFSFLLSSFCFH